MEINDWLGLMDQRTTLLQQSLISRNALFCNCHCLNKSLQENSKRNAGAGLVTTGQMAASIPNKSPKEQIICVSIVLFPKTLCSIYNFSRCQYRLYFFRIQCWMKLSQSEISPEVEKYGQRFKELICNISFLCLQINSEGPQAQTPIRLKKKPALMECTEMFLLMKQWILHYLSYLCLSWYRILPFGSDNYHAVMSHCIDFLFPLTATSNSFP